MKSGSEHSCTFKVEGNAYELHGIICRWAEQHSPLAVSVTGVYTSQSWRTGESAPPRPPARDGTLRIGTWEDKPFDEQISNTLRMVAKEQVFKSLAVLDVVHLRNGTRVEVEARCLEETFLVEFRDLLSRIGEAFDVPNLLPSKPHKPKSGNAERDAEIYRLHTVEGVSFGRLAQRYKNAWTGKQLTERRIEQILKAQREAAEADLNKTE